MEIEDEEEVADGDGEAERGDKAVSLGVGVREGTGGRRESVVSSKRDWSEEIRC